MLIINRSKALLRTTLLIFLCLLNTTALAEQLIIEPDMGREPVLTQLNNARQSVHLVMYGFTDDTLFNAFLTQKQRGRSLKVILERSPFRNENENNRIITLFKQHHIDWQGSIPDMRLIHQKTLIIDGKKALVMTFNFTRSAFDDKKSHPARNFGLLIDDAKTVNDIETIFSADWNHVPAHISNPNLIYSPDNSRNDLLQHINRAQQSIKMYAQQLSDYEIIAALSNAARRGIKVEVLMAAKLNDKQKNFLATAGVNVQRSTHYYIHAKVFIIDNKTAIIGSINMSRASLDDNRELSVVTHHPATISALAKTFLHDWQSNTHS